MVLFSKFKGLGTITVVGKMLCCFDVIASTYLGSKQLIIVLSLAT